MQITATIQDAVAADQTINVGVLFEDGKGGQVRKILNFQNGTDLTAQAVTDEITRQAIAKAKIGLSETAIKLLVGTVIVADEKTPPPLVAVAASADAVADLSAPVK